MRSAPDHLGPARDQPVVAMAVPERRPDLRRLLVEHRVQPLVERGLQVALDVLLPLRRDDLRERSQRDDDVDAGSRRGRRRPGGWPRASRRRRTRCSARPASPSSRGPRRPACASARSPAVPRSYRTRAGRGRPGPRSSSVGGGPRSGRPAPPRPRGPRGTRPGARSCRSSAARCGGAACPRAGRGGRGRGWVPCAPGSRSSTNGAYHTDPTRRGAPKRPDGPHRRPASPGAARRASATPPPPAYASR